MVYSESATSLGLTLHGAPALGSSLHRGRGLGWSLLFMSGSLRRGHAGLVGGSLHQRRVAPIIVHYAGVGRAGVIVLDLGVLSLCPRVCAVLDTFGIHSRAIYINLQWPFMH